MPITPVDSWLDQLLLGAVNKLVGDKLFPPSACFLSLTPDKVKYPPTDQFVCISPGPQSIDRPYQIGGGRVTLLIHGNMTVTLHSRLALDEYQRDDSFLTDSTLGALAKAKCVVNALELYQPTDEGGNLLLHKGFELKAIETFSRDVEGVGWGLIRIGYIFDWTVILGC